jgi:hypothetical protein
VQRLCEHPTYTNDKVNKKDNNNDIVIDLECKRVFNNRQQFFFFARLTNFSDDDD